jgi:hypothetical protein
MNIALFDIDEANNILQCELKRYLITKYPFLPDTFINEIKINITGVKTLEELKKRADILVYRHVVYHVKTEIEKLCCANQELLRIKPENYEKVVTDNNNSIINLTLYL